MCLWELGMASSVIQRAVDVGGRKKGGELTGAFVDRKRFLLPFGLTPPYCWQVRKQRWVRQHAQTRMQTQRIETTSLIRGERQTNGGRRTVSFFVSTSAPLSFVKIMDPSADASTQSRFKPSWRVVRDSLVQALSRSHCM